MDGIRTRNPSDGRNTNPELRRSVEAASADASMDGIRTRDSTRTQVPGIGSEHRCGFRAPEKLGCGLLTLRKHGFGFRTSGKRGFAPCPSKGVFRPQTARARTRDARMDLTRTRDSADGREPHPELAATRIRNPQQRRPARCATALALQPRTAPMRAGL